MSTTVLERLEFTVEDFAPPCEDGTCGRAATHVVRLTCDCIALLCIPCITHQLALLASAIGNDVICEQCQAEVELDHVSDFILSIDPI